VGERAIKEVSQLEHSLESLRLSEALHRSIVATAVDAILVVDDRAIIESMNIAGERMFGYTGHEVIGWPIHILIPEFTLERQDKSFETVGRRKDGRVFHMEVNLSDVRVDGCRLFPVIARDITQRTKLEREVLAISWREQARIGQDLHDTVCQYLVGIQFMCSVLVERLAAQELAETPSARRIGELTGQALTETRRLAKGLFPVELKEDGLELALRGWAAQLESQFGVTVSVHCPNPISIKDNETATHLFRIAQEAVNNAIRHGRAKRVDIDLAVSETTTSLIVKDDGQGFPGSPGVRRGMGLNIMKYRATIIGGTLSIKSAAEGGTIVVCSLTIPENLSQRSGQPR
jgi:two-component system, LuxR family, sensor kinase FixL